MSTTVRTVLEVAERLWPAAGAESWDSVGLVSGDPGDEVGRIQLAVDAVAATVDEAAGNGADVLLVHHPLLLRGVTSIAEDTAKGRLLAKLVRSRCALLTAHTNADVVDDGTSGMLARLLGLQDIRPLTPAASAAPGHGIGRTGRLAAPTTLGALAETLAGALPPTAVGVRVAGDERLLVETVALCGGAGDSLLAHPLVLAADVYITSDLRHHPASEAREAALLRRGRPALIDISHWASEWLWLRAAARALSDELPDVTVAVSRIVTDPWDFVVTPSSER